MQNNPVTLKPWQPWLVVFTAALYFFYDFIQLNMFNALNAPLIEEFHVSAAQLGQLSAYYFYAVIPLLFPAGILLDRISTRKIILVTMSLITVTTLIFSMAHHFWITGVCHFITGVGGTFCLLSCVRLATRWFPPRRMALVIGLIVTMAMLGGMVAQTPLTWLVETMGWRHALFLDGILGLFFVLLIALVVKDFPPGMKAEQDKFHGFLSELGFLKSLRLTLANSQNWLGGFYTCFMNLPIFLLGGLWGSMYLSQAHPLTRIQASYVTSMIFVGTIIGAPVLGWFSDRIGLRRMPMLVCGVLSLIVILLIMFISQLTLGMSMLLFLLLGFFTSAQIISYPLIAESNSHALTGTAEGLASVLIMGGGLTQPLFGWLMGLHWHHTVVNNMPIYSSSDYLLAMSIMPIAFVLGLIAAFAIKETYCRAQENTTIASKEIYAEHTAKN